MLLHLFFSVTSVSGNPRLSHPLGNPLGNPLDNPLDNAYVSAGGHGGGAMISVPPDHQPHQPDVAWSVCEFASFWPHSHASRVTLTSATVRGNRASTGKSSVQHGGGLYVGPGGFVTLTNVSLTSNLASQFGGGLATGAGGGGATCALSLVGCHVADNTAGHAGAQVYMGCSAGLSAQDSAFTLSTTGSQVGPGPELMCRPHLARAHASSSPSPSSCVVLT